MIRWCGVAVLLVVQFSGCAPSLVQTQWDHPKDARLRITTDYDDSVIEIKLPATIQLPASPGYGYFVEIMTADRKKMYGTMKVMYKTDLTELSSVKVDITEEIVKKVLGNQVSQITVNDPTERLPILRLNLGSRMPSDMKKHYEKLSLKAY